MPDDVPDYDGPIRPLRPDFDCEPRQPSVPTKHYPRTASKIDTLCKRAELGLDLFSPDDAVLPRHLALLFEHISAEESVCIGVVDLRPGCTDRAGKKRYGIASRNRRPSETNVNCCTRAAERRRKRAARALNALCRDANRKLSKLQTQGA